MPGQVKSIAVEAGDAVHKGQTLIVLEAMKMEMRVQSPQDGRVRAVHVRPGQTVEREQILIEVEE
jgi:biotin carboxyl carrier protein